VPDFHTSIASLRVAQRTLSAAIAAGRVPARAAPRLRAALAAAPDMAAFGALLDTTLYHCGPTQPELDLLTKAAGLWGRFRQLMGELAAVRGQFESLVANPNQPDVVGQTQSLASHIPRLGDDVKQWSDDATAFIKGLSQLTYLPEVGQSHDAPVGRWSWLDLATGRRTGALRAALLDRAVASADQGAVAFACAAIAGYAGRLCASGYGTRVVGGPRRSHPYRSRLAARTVGAWVRQNYPGDTVPLTDLGQRVAALLGNPPAFPRAARAALAGAMADAYRGVAPAPDLDLAAARVAQHLQLLSILTMSDPGASPPVPVPAPVSAAVQTAAQSRGLSAAQFPTFPMPPGPNPAVSIATGVGPFWKTLLASVLTILLGLAFAVLGFLIAGPPGAGIGAGLGVGLGTWIGVQIGAWKLDDRQVSAATRQADLRSDQAIQVCYGLELLQEALYAAGDQFLVALKAAGLAYPEGRDLSSVLFGQFLTMPRYDPVFRRPDHDPNHFTVYPQTDVEVPNRVGSYPYRAGSSPAAFLDAPGGPPDATVAGLGPRLWLEEEAGGGGTDLRQRNRQLDADLGPADVCWRGRVTVTPIQVTPLAYPDL
jgi:hypothetical protein